MARGRGRRARRPRWVLVLVVVALVVAGVAWWIARPRGSEVEVYFVRFDDAHRKGTLEVVHRPAPRGPVDVRLDGALRALLHGPRTAQPGNERTLVTEIPAGTALLGVRVSDGTVTVNLSKTFAAGGGSTSMLARVWQVVYTATQSPDAPAAQILIDGRRVAALGGEGVMIGSPLRRSAAPPWF